jgi:uncharacterized protein YndB with AHSA1/START domain
VIGVAPRDGSVTTFIDAPPQTIWDLLSDVTRIGEFSPETFEAEWLDGATGPAPGVRFRGHVKRNGIGPIYWTTCVVVDADPCRDFAFAVGSDTDDPLNLWRYRIEPAGSGAYVTESFALSKRWWIALHWVFLGWARRRTNIRGMTATLARIKRVAESDARRH